MTLDIRAEIAGLKAVQAKNEQMVRDLHGEGLMRGMKQAVLLVTRDIKMTVSVDTGRYRASITPEVRVEGKTVIGVVGSNVVYAPYREFGTRPHWVPRGALATWAERHGISEFAVRLAIARMGTRAERAFQNAFEKNKEAIKQLIGKTIEAIVRR